MLRITLQDLPTEVTLKLEGRVGSDSVGELERSWQTVCRSLGGRRLCLDIRGITFVSPEGRQLLARIYKETRNDFRANTPLTNFLAEEASGRNVQQKERM